MPAVPMPDPDTEKTLDAAREQAAAGLRGRFPDSMLAPPPPAQPKVTNSITNSVGQNLANAPPPLPPAAPSPDAQPVIDSTPAEPGPAAIPVKDDQTYADDLARNGKELGSEVGNGFMRAAAATARTLGFAAAGATHLVPGVSEDTQSKIDDKVFNFVRDHVDTAYDYWKGDPNNNPTAQFVGNVAEGAAPMMLGPAGAATMAGNSAVEAGKNSIDAGDNIKTAVALATIAGLTTTAQLKIGYKDPSVIKRIAKWVGAGDIIDQAGKATEILARHILNDDTYKEAAAKVDPLNPTEMGINSIMQAIFGILHTPDGAKLAAKADKNAKPQAPDLAPVPAPDATPVTTDVPPPPPASTATPPIADQSAAPPVADQPSAEPRADLQAQVADMLDPNTPRKAVYLSKENVESLGPQGVKDLAGKNVVTKNFDRNGGVLITPTIGDRVKAANLRKANGDDMQKTLGALTGAGDGKQPDMTAVVQGQDDQGNVVKEQGVAPADIPAAVAATQAESKTPVVTTPEAAIQRRAELVSKEIPSDTAVPVTEAASPVTAPKPEGDTEVSTAGVSASEPVPLKPGARRIVKIAGEDVPVVIATAPDGNKVGVHLVDDEGRVSKDVRQVPLEMFKTPDDTASSAPAAAAELSALSSETPVKGEDVVAATAEPTHPLTQALDIYNQEPAKESVKAHASRVAELARAVLAAAKDTNLPDAVRAHATKIANRLAKIDTKSDEAYTKGRGVSHRMLDAYGDELARAAHNIVEPAKAVIPEKIVQTKADTLKAKIAKEREAATKPKEPTSEKVKAKQGDKVKSAIPDVEDATKPKSEQLNAGEKAKIGNALKRYMEVADEDAPGAHDNLERILHDVYGPDRAAESDQILTLAREQRADMRGTDDHSPKRMSETLEPGELEGTYYDEGRGFHDQGDEGDANELRMSDAEYKGTPMGKLHDALQDTGFWKQLSQVRDKGQFLGTHAILDHLVNVAKDNPVMQHLLGKLRQHVPDLPIRPVSGVVHPDNGREMGATAGLFHARTSTIQVKLHRLAGDLDRVPTTTTHALIHEIAHAATSYEVYTNPQGKFAKDIRSLLATAREHAAETNQTHYGLHDEHEFIAESLTNPDFQKFLAEAKPAGSQGTSIFRKIAQAVSKMLGIKDPRATSLLHDAMHTIEEGINAQARNLPESMHRATVQDFLKHNREAAARLTAKDTAPPSDHMPALDDMLRQLPEEPRPLENEDEFRGVMGDHATMQARLFRRAIRGGYLETIRRTVRSLTPYDGLIRSALRRGVFGHNDETNPLRNYDNLIQERNAVINRMAHSAEPIVNDRAKLSYTDNKKLGNFQDYVGTLGMYVEKPADEQPLKARSDKKFQAKYDDLQARWRNLTEAQKDIYRRERDWNEKAMRANRKAGIDVALDSFSDKDIPKAHRQLLYSITNPHEGFDDLIGPGKVIDVGDRNENLKDALKDLSSTAELEGDYFHKGRYGDHVVQVNREGTKNFKDQNSAEIYAEKIRALSPGSKAKVAHVGDSWQVDYKAEHVSFHETPAEADEAAAKLRAQGLDVGVVTQKILSEKNAPLSSGMQNIVAEASRRIDRQGSSDAADDLKANMRNAFLSLQAARSAYAGSKLARRNVGGVKGEEMGRSFATHAQSLAWNTGHLATVFKLGEALGKLREATKDSEQPQATASQRGRVYDEIARRLRQETEQYGSHVPFNSTLAKAGFLNYMTSVSHAMIYLTQNFTTAIPHAGAKFGYAKAAGAFMDAMKMISGPAFRETYRAVLMSKGHNVDSIQHAILAAVAKDKRFGKWAVGGDNSPLQQLIDRGIVHTSLSNQLASTAKGGSAFANRVMEWARILPSMADIFNRVSTGVAALELHKGDVYKAGDFVKATHIDYSQENKPRAYRMFNRIPGGNSVTMFKSYVTGMSHLLYSHIYDTVAGGAEGGRGEALKTVAGMMLGTALFAGVQRGFGLEPLRAAMFAYHKLVGDSDQYYSFDNTSRRAVSALTGGGKLAEVINGGLPRAVGFDMSSRMGLSDLFLHDPPDITSMDRGDFAKFGFAQLGPIAQELSENVESLSKAFTTGQVSELTKAIPIKAAQNVFDAYKAGTTGKVNSAGAQLTEPSAGAALTHLVGFRTAQEAKLSEQTATDMEYKQFANNKKYTLIAAYAKTPPAERAAFFDSKIKQWNEDNPGHRISFSDLRKQMKSILSTERTAQGLPGRDSVQNQLNDY